MITCEEFTGKRRRKSHGRVHRRMVSRDDILYFFFWGLNRGVLSPDVSGNQMQIQVPCYFFYHAFLKEQKKKLKEKSMTYHMRV